MAVRQYIGARYVIKIYQNSQNPSSMEWENREFEPLTVVSYLNNTYISRDTVPINAGVPTSATSHWALFGSSNGAILDLQRRVGTLEGDVSDLDTKLETYYNYNLWHNKSVVVYGDSLSTVAYNYWQYMTAKDPTIQVTNRAVGGSRIQDGYTLVQAATDLDDFDIVVLAYGTNSWANTSLREMVTAYMNTIHEISGKSEARIVCIAPYYSYNPDFGASSINSLGFSMYDYSSAITYVANIYGCVAFNLYDLTGVNQWNYTDYLEESSSGVYVHENEKLGRRIADILLGSSPSQTLSQAFKYYEFATNVGIMVIKCQGFVLIYQRGTVAVSDLLALNLNHIAPAGYTSCIVRGRNLKNTAYVSLSASGDFAIDWSDGNADTEIQGLCMIGFTGTNYQPH